MESCAGPAGEGGCCAGEGEQGRARGREGERLHPGRIMWCGEVTRVRIAL